MINIRRQEKDISGCAIIGILNEDGSTSTGHDIIRGIATMHDRSNGLGGGFAAYGIYPEYHKYFAFHIMYETKNSMEETETFLEKYFIVEHSEEIPFQEVSSISSHPLLRRYFVLPKKTEHSPILGGKFEKIDDEEYVVRSVFKINTEIEDAFVFSSGKNCGSFKAVGYPEDVGKFFKLEDYEAYSWIAHGRFPTNSQAWWGGAHPFSLLNSSVVHNGEISSYGINKRFLESYGYPCTSFTDTEVICYLIDLFNRKKNISFEMTSKILAAPFWKEIEHMALEDKEIHKKIRTIYSSALLNGPFSIVVAFEGGMFGLNDRLKLRPLVAARSKNRLYLGSEEAAIMESNELNSLDKIWHPRGGEIVIGRVK